MPHKFHFTEFELTRNMMAVMIGYMFGLRATTLFDLTLDDIKITMPEPGVRTLTLKKQVCKNFCRNEFSEPRVFAPGQFSDIMAELFSVFLTMKRYMYSYRMIEQPSGDTMNPANFIPFDNKEALETNFASAAKLDAFLDRIDDAHVVSEGGRIWSIPGEYVTKDNATKVTSWLKSSLKRAELSDEAMHGRKLTSHVIRSGAASAFVRQPHAARQSQISLRGGNSTRRHRGELHRAFGGCAAGASGGELLLGRLEGLGVLRV